MPEWAERQLLHPEERRGREGKEGERGGREREMPAGRPAGAGSRGLQRAPEAVLSPPPGPCSPGEGVIAWGSGGGDGGRDGTDTGLGY